MGIQTKLQALNDTDLSRLARRINDLIPKIDPPSANTGPAAPAAPAAAPRIDEAWVRQNVVPILDKIDKLRK